MATGDSYEDSVKSLMAMGFTREKEKQFIVQDGFKKKKDAEDQQEHETELKIKTGLQRLIEKYRNIVKTKDEDTDILCQMIGVNEKVDKKINVLLSQSAEVEEVLEAYLKRLRKLDKSLRKYNNSEAEEKSDPTSDLIDKNENFRPQTYSNHSQTYIANNR
eukprot:UN01309